MREDLTEVAVIVDRSGSMEAIRSDAIGGFNSFLAEQKKGAGELRITVVLFNHEIETIHARVPVAGVPPLDPSTYLPSGTTALHDAFGRTIDELGQRLAATPEPERPGRVMVAVLTDGLENASRDYTLRQIRQRVRRQREKYGWEFVFLAAGQDAVLEGAKLAIPAADAIAFDATSEGIRGATAALSARVSRRRGTVVN
ncbi:MAG: VWA domain-containing protein [Thermoanaerobaculia bacterium]|nr:MAG: VWA domain-containing protein [Thermoanaerobaculia bacterium]